MSHTRARRRASLITLLTSAALVGATSAPSVAATDSGPARTGSGWLSVQPKDGMIVTKYGDFPPYDDHGLTLDAYYAMRATGSQLAARGAIIDRLSRQDEIDEYTKQWGFASGSLGKLLTALEMSGRDLSKVGGGTLRQDLESAVSDSGRANGNGADDYGNAINQAWVVRALALGHSSLTAKATSFLLRQQCAGGYFRESISDGGGCAQAAPDAKSPSVEATAFAVRALLDARAAGVKNLGDDLADARGWLVRAQRADGGYRSNSVTNADATGLAADALRRTGAAGAAGNAAGWLLAHQVSAGVVESSPALKGQRGAVAYDDAALSAARKKGIAESDVYQWRKATADGVLGLMALLPAKRAGLVAPDRVKRGSEALVRIRGLRVGERFVLKRNSHVVARGVVPASGVAKREVTFPRRGKVVLKVVGSRPGRLGSTAVHVR